MPVEIQLLPSFKLGVKENTQLHLPTIQIVPIKSNIPYISRITCIVRGTPNELAAQIQKSYRHGGTKFYDDFQLATNGILP
jgi:hypothetical protein